MREKMRAKMRESQGSDLCSDCHTDTQTDRHKGTNMRIRDLCKEMKNQMNGEKPKTAA